MARQRVPLPFGAGLDRATGTMSRSPRTLADAINVFASEGKMLAIPSLLPTWFPSSTGAQGEDDYIAISGLLATKDIILVSLDRDTGDVDVWRINPIAVPTLQHVGLWATLGGSALTPPRIIIAESFGKLYLAHDEPLIGSRLNTQVYTPNAVDANVGSIANLTANLDSLGSQPVKFRGVYHYNDSLWGWGYGTNSDADRPEVLRVSRPGEPDIFSPQALFYAGGRKDAITAVVAVGSILAVRKRTEGYRVIGRGPATYAIEPAEKGYGCENARLAIAVGGSHGTFVWDHTGPRELLGDGTSVPVGDLFALRVPDDILAGPTLTAVGVPFAGQSPGDVFEALFPLTPVPTPSQMRFGFVVHEYNERVLRWVFPNIDSSGTRFANSREWIISLGEKPPQLSVGMFRDAQPFCAATVPLDKVLVPPTIVATADQLAINWDSAGLVDKVPSFISLPAVTWRNASLLGDEVVLVRARPSGGGKWTAMALVPVALVPNVAQPTQKAVLPYPTFFRQGDEYDIGIQFIRPDSWPSMQAGSTTSPMLTEQQRPGDASMRTVRWRRISATRHIVQVGWYASASVAIAAIQSDLTGAQADMVLVTDDTRLVAVPISDAHLALNGNFRVQVRGTGAAVFNSTTLQCFIGPVLSTGTSGCGVVVLDYAHRSSADPSTLELFLAVNPEVAAVFVQNGITLAVAHDAGPDSFTVCRVTVPNFASTHFLNLRARVAAFGVTDLTPGTNPAITDPSGGVPATPSAPATSFPAALTARVTFSDPTPDRIIGYFEWVAVEGSGVERAWATVVTSGAAFDTVLPESARGKTISYTFWRVTPTRVMSADTAAAVLGVCP